MVCHVTLMLTLMLMLMPISCPSHAMSCQVIVDAADWNARLPDAITAFVYGPEVRLIRMS